MLSNMKNIWLGITSEYADMVVDDYSTEITHSSLNKWMINTTFTLDVVKYQNIVTNQSLGL